MQLAVEGLQGIQAKVGGEASRRIAAILTELDAANRSLQVALRTAYTAIYASDPCAGYPILVREVQQILLREDRNRRVLLYTRALEATLDPTKDAAATNRALEDLEQMLFESPVQTEAREGISAASEAIREWSGTQ
jgi:hypothetical protein